VSGERWVDSHCHLTSLSGGADAAVERARAAGVVGMVCVGTNAESSRASIDVASRHASVRATAGLHPHDASSLAAQREEIEALVRAPEVAAVGETGFDLHYNYSPRDEQEAAFRLQIRLAHGLGLALVIHSRAAWDDTFRVLDDEGVPSPTVFHCFTGGAPEAARALEMGAYLSFSGIVSFTNADDVRTAAASTPLDRMLVETDAPYLAPVPHRGRENEPAWVGDVGAALAAATGHPPERVAAATRANAADLFGF